MGWIMLMITICAGFVALLTVKKNPKFALFIAVLVPFITFYYIGKNGYNDVFSFASILYYVIGNILLMRHLKHKNTSS